MTRDHLPPEAWEALHKMARLARRPLERFFRIEAASGILLLGAAAIAMVLANSRWSDEVRSFWQLEVGLQIGGLEAKRTLEWVVNDVLMVIFFFVVGMEIKRELHHGELSEWRRAALPVVAALGGMVVPAALYWAWAGRVAPQGWGVPMATDIAFAVGVLTLLGSRVPPALRVLLLALAVIDDLGAIVVIAVFYSGGIKSAGLGLAAASLALIYLAQRAGVRSRVPYVVLGAVVWYGIYHAGVHPTIAGVLVGLMTPVRAWLGAAGVIAGAEQAIGKLVGRGDADPHELALAMAPMDHARREAMSPAESLIHALHPWVAFLIMPVFALANAGVAIDVSSLGGVASVVMMGITAGLVLGKPIGIVAACWLAIKSGLATLPHGLSVRHLWVLGVVAGIGFTMAIFIAQLAFLDATQLLSAAKLGVLLASVVAGVVGLGLGFVLLSRQMPAGAAKTADEAESSAEV